MRRACVPASLWLLAAGTLPCAGQEQREAEIARQFQARAKESAAAYDIRAGSETGKKLVLHEEPILRWTNPVPEKQMHGEVFLWTDDDRPAAVLCLFEMTERGVVRECHEFCSLAALSLVTAGPGDRRWSPEAAPLTLSPLADAPPPAGNPRQRLAQMRELAGRFTCEKTTRLGETRPLRLLSQPVHRYSSPAYGVLDGALFAWVEATDPELFLLLESREVGGAAQWKFALARMASVHLTASLAGRTVWEVDTIPFSEYRNRPDKPYTLLMPRP